MAGLVPFGPLNTSDRDIQLLDNELSRCFAQFTSNQLLTGVLRPVSFSKVDSDVVVPHNLGSFKVSFIAHGLNLPAMVFQSQTKGNANQLILQCETSRTISAQSPLTGYVWAYLVN